MNSLKIEIGAILSLRNIIFKHPLMHDYINDNDKEPSWDGFIYLYKSDDFKAENITHRVPVQVKGKNDQALLNRKSITYPVEYKHLRNYYRDGGVLYIVVAISDDGEKTTIFYNALSTIKLADLLKRSEDKRPDQTKSIALQRLEKGDSDSLYKVLAQLGMDREKQGSGNGEVVKKAINIDDMDKIDCIQATSYFAKSETDIFKEIVTGQVSLYGHRSDLNMWFPFDYAHQKEIVVKRVIQMNKPIGIDGVNFYNLYFVEGTATAEEKPIIRVSENLTIDLIGGKINFDTVGTLNSLLNDVSFINAIIEGSSFYVNNQKITEITNVNIPESMKERMQMVMDLDNAFKEIGFICNKKFGDFTEDNWKCINELLGIYHRKIVPREGKDNAWHLWYWEGKVVPLLLSSNGDEKIDVINWFTTKKYALFVDSENHCALPNFVLFKRDILEKLYDIPKNIWLDEIERIEYSEENIPQVLLFFVEVLAAYDITQNEIYYEVAELLTDKILEVRPEDDYVIINKMQLLKRKGILCEEYIVKLEDMEEKTDNIMVKCAVNILLENKRKAKKIISELPDVNKDELMNYPIYNLL